MLINISSDAVFINCPQKSICVSRQGLEVQLPQIIHSLYDDNAIGNRVYVLNGPGSFTNLRVGCLVLNMLKDFIPNLQLYTLPKWDMYNTLYQDGLIPSQGIMYIGQQKNYRLIDFATQQCDKVTILPDQRNDYLSDPYWTDEATVFDKTHMVQCDMTQDYDIVCSYQGRQWTGAPELLGFVLVDTLTPHYILEPNISTPRAGR